MYLFRLKKCRFGKKFGEFMPRKNFLCVRMHRLGGGIRKFIELTTKGGIRKFIELTRGGGMYPVMQDKKIFLLCQYV